jgi:hypothetical protein
MQHFITLPHPFLEKSNPGREREERKKEREKMPLIVDTGFPQSALRTVWGKTLLFYVRNQGGGSVCYSKIANN